MNYTNIASILNTEIIPNTLGLEVTIAENLSNIVELGTKVSAMTSDQLKDFKKQVVVGVYTYVMGRLYKAKKFDMLKNSIEYGGGIQRIMASGLFSAQDSHLLNLINGQSYLDGKFYGTNIDSVIYVDTKAFKVVHSISDDDFSQMFMTAEDTANFIGLIATTEQNTIEVQLSELSKRVLLMVISSTYDDFRTVQLLTEFNNKLGLTDTNRYTLSDILKDRDLTSYFSDYCKETIARITDYIRDINKKYNDGTIVTFTPKDKVKGIFITEFITDIEYLGNPRDYNAPPMLENLDTCSAWQNTTTKMLPPLEDATKIVIANGSENKTYNNIVGVIYDMDCCGITVKRDKVTVELVGTEGFTNFHHHLCNNYYVDTRLGAVVFTLD